MNDLKLRVCPSCEQAKPRTKDYFSKDRNRPDGLYSYCLECSRKRNCKAYIDNRPAVLARSKEYARENNWKYQKIWSKNNPNISRFIALKSSAKGRGLATCTRKEFLVWYSEQLAICHYCSATNTRLTIDRKDNRFGYYPGNMVIACNYCNTSKGTTRTYEKQVELANKVRSNI
jgi:hypothetical protein